MDWNALIVVWLGINTNVLIYLLILSWNLGVLDFQKAISYVHKNVSSHCCMVTTICLPNESWNMLLFTREFSLLASKPILPLPLQGSFYNDS